MDMIALGVQNALENPAEDPVSSVSIINDMITEREFTLASPQTTNRAV